MASPNLSEIITTTLRNRSKDIADNVSKGNILLNVLNTKGNVKPADGGRVIVQSLDYQNNSTFQWYSGYEVLNINPSDVITAAEYDWKQASTVVTASGLEVHIQNTGMEQVYDLLETRMNNAEKTLKNNFTLGVYSDGTGSSGKQLGGLLTLVSDTPTTGVVGGIDASLWSFWQNQLYDFSVQTVTSSSTTIQAAMQALWLLTQRGTDVTDTIVFDSAYYQYWWQSQTAIQRYTSGDTANAGYASLKFNSANTHYEDSGIGSKHGYFLNTDYIFLRPHSKVNMTPLETRNSINQDAIVVPIVWAGNMTCSNRARQGVMHE